MVEIRSQLVPFHGPEIWLLAAVEEVLLDEPVELGEPQSLVGVEVDSSFPDWSEVAAKNKVSLLFR